jgi:hypothetical protein
MRGSGRVNVYRLLLLTCLAPDIVEAILDGRQPKGLRLAASCDLKIGPTQLAERCSIRWQPIRHELLRWTVALHQFS